MKKHLLLLSLILFVSACASQRPKEASNYHTDLVYPTETKSFVFQEIHVFDEPLLGAVLTYVDWQYPQDNISVYVYPVPVVDWEDVKETMNFEMDRVIKEIDYSVNAGHYRSRTAEQREPFEFSADGKEFSGLKASLDLELTTEQRLDSNVYLFVSQDKVIKFRTSFLSQPELNLNGDKVVMEVLPELTVPPESVHMKKVRAEHKKAQDAMLLKLLLEALENKKAEEAKQTTTDKQH